MDAMDVAVDNLLDEFRTEQRRLLTLAMDQAIDKAMHKQSELLDRIKTRVVERQQHALTTLRDDLTRQQPTMMDMVITKTLDSSTTSSLVHWIEDPNRQQQARECIDRLRQHLETRQGNSFRSDFEALLVVYMEYLQIPMTRGSRLPNRIEDFKDALQQKAVTDDLSSLMYRVSWACYGVRTIGNARSHDTSPLSEAEMLELCGCFSALGAAMPTLALEFDVQKSPAVDTKNDNDSVLQDTVTNTADESLDLSMLNQLLMGSSTSVKPEQLVQLLAARLNAGTNGAPTTTTMEANRNFVSTSAIPTNAPPLPPGFAPLPPAENTPPLPPGFPSMPSIGNASVPPGAIVTTNASRGRLPSPSSGHLPMQNTNPIATSLPPSMKLSPTVLADVASFKFYYDRPTDIPRETDRTRLAMFNRMLNHMNLVPKARLCPYEQGHDPSCPQSHSYLEVMSYNPVFKRLVCRQPSHYYSNQVEEDDHCVCIHVDTGLKWDWMDESRDKRAYCTRGDKCTNVKCFKSHSFEELCWYNPSYKIKKCAIRSHDYIVKARGTIAPPLECNYYHLEDGPKADMRQLMVEDDHVGKPVKMLFVERTHKLLADALEALRYVRANNL